jgi:phage gp37-like protein
VLPIFTSLAFAGDERSMLEDAARLCLMPLYKMHGGPLELLDFYNGELDTEEGAEDLIQKLLGNAPAVLLAAGEARFEPSDLRRRRYSESLSLHVLIASRHLRDRESRNRRDVTAVHDRTRDPGCYALMRAVKDLLIGRDLAVTGLEPLQPIQEDVVVQGGGLTLWRILFRATYAETRPDPAKSFGSTVPVSVIRIRHHQVDQDGDGVGYRDVAVTEIE